MNIFNDTIDNRDTEFTIDTYSCFTLESELDQEIDYLASNDSDELRASYGLPEFDSDRYIIDDYLDFSYDMASYTKALAEASIDIIKELDSKFGNSLEIFSSIELIGNDAPTYYNYTTNSYTMSIDYDRDKLSAWIVDDKKAECQNRANLRENA